MDFEPKNYKLKNMGEYLAKSIKFYDLKKDYFAPVIFVLLLAVNFITQLKALEYYKHIEPLLFFENFEDIEKFTPYIISFNLMYLFRALIVTFITSIYLAGYIREIKNEEYSLGLCVWKASKKYITIILASIIVIILMFLGAILFVVPMLVFFTMFILHRCYILDKGFGVIPSLKLSANTTNGYKMKILRMFIVFYLIFIILPSFIVGGSPIISAFIFSFIGTIVSLIYQRFLAHIYKDLEYGELDEQQEVE